LALSFLLLVVRRPPLSTLFPTRRSSDLASRNRTFFAVGDRGLVPRWKATSRGRWRSTREGCAAIRAHEAAHAEWQPLYARLSRLDRKSTRLNSSHEWISYAVFCLKKKNR